MMTNVSTFSSYASNIDFSKGASLDPSKYFDQTSVNSGTLGSSTSFTPVGSLNAPGANYDPQNLAYGPSETPAPAATPSAPPAIRPYIWKYQ